MRRILPFALAVLGILVLFIVGSTAPLSGTPRYVEQGFVAAVPTLDTLQTKDFNCVPAASGVCLPAGKGVVGFAHPFCISLENTC